MSLPFEVEPDALEVPLQGQRRAPRRQGRALLGRPLPQAGVQVPQLPVEPRAQLAQEGRVPGGRGGRCEQEVEDLLEQLVEDSGGLGPLHLTALHRLPGESEVFSVLETQERGHCAHLAQKH